MRQYESGYGASRPISAAERAAEVVCGRSAAHLGRPIGERFWSDPAWSSTFRQQLQAAHRLLKLYDGEVLLATLDANPRVRSLAPSFVAELVAAEQGRADDRLRRAAEAPPPEAHDTNKAPRPAAGRGGLRAKLKGL